MTSAYTIDPASQDAADLRYLTAPFGGDPRPTLLPFGNSFALQSCCTCYTTTTTIASGTSAPAGSTSLTVASSSAFSPGDKVLIQLYTGEPFTTTIVSVPDGTHIVVADKLPKSTAITAGVHRYTTAGAYPYRRNGGGIIPALLALGSPYNVLTGYGFGGGSGSTMLADLATWLRVCRPHAVWLQLVDNELPGGVAVSEMQRTVRTAVEMSLRAGCVIYAGTPVPRTLYNTPTLIENFDAMRDWMMTLGALYPPDRVIPINMSDGWRDLSDLTKRAPLLSVASDGTHPSPVGYGTLASVIAPQISAVVPALPALSKWTDLAVTTNAALAAGAGGAAGGSGAASVSGAVPAGWLVTNQSTGTVVACSRSTEGNARFISTIAGASDYSANIYSIGRTESLALNVRGGQMLKGIAVVKVNSNTGLSVLRPSIAFSTGESFEGHLDAGWMSDSYWVGKTVMLETPPVEPSIGATTATIDLSVRPLARSSPSGVSVDIEVLALAIVPADRPVRGGIVLP